MTKTKRPTIIMTEKTMTMRWHLECLNGDDNCDDTQMTTMKMMSMSMTIFTSMNYDNGTNGDDDLDPNIQRWHASNRL
jgi:hypothetical protein